MVVDPNWAQNGVALPEAALYIILRALVFGVGEDGVCDCELDHGTSSGRSRKFCSVQDFRSFFIVLSGGVGERGGMPIISWAFRWGWLLFRSGSVSLVFAIVSATRSGPLHNLACAGLWGW